MSLKQVEGRARVRMLVLVADESTKGHHSVRS